MLDELDRRQEEILRELDQLNGQIEQLMARWQSRPDGDLPAA